MKGLCRNVWRETPQRQGYLFKPSVPAGPEIAQLSASAGLRSLRTWRWPVAVAEPSEPIPLSQTVPAWLAQVSRMPVTEGGALVLLSSLHFPSPSLGIITGRWNSDCSSWCQPVLIQQTPSVWSRTSMAGNPLPGSVVLTCLFTKSQKTCRVRATPSAEQLPHRSPLGLFYLRFFGLLVFPNCKTPPLTPEPVTQNGSVWGA